MLQKNTLLETWNNRKGPSALSWYSKFRKIWTLPSKLYFLQCSIIPNVNSFVVNETSAWNPRTSLYPNTSTCINFIPFFFNKHLLHIYFLAHRGKIISPSSHNEQDIDRTSFKADLSNSNSEELFLVHLSPPQGEGTNNPNHHQLLFMVGPRREYSVWALLKIVASGSFQSAVQSGGQAWSHGMEAEIPLQRS